MPYPELIKFSTDFRLPLKELIARCNFEYVHPLFESLTARTFRNRFVQKEYIVRQFDRPFPGVLIPRVAEEHEMRAAEFPELLSFNLVKPRLKIKFPVGQAGTFLVDLEEQKYIAYIDETFSGGRALFPYLAEEYVGGDFNFLVEPPGPGA